MITALEISKSVRSLYDQFGEKVEGRLVVSGWQAVLEVLNDIETLLPAGIGDELMSDLILDSSIDWHELFVASSSESYPVSMLGHLWLTRISPFRDAMPRTLAALDARYTPSEQVELLRWLPVRLPSNRQVLTSREMLCARLAQAVLQSEEHLDAWVCEWARSLKGTSGRDQQVSVRSGGPIPYEHTTSLYRQLEPSELDMGAVYFAIPCAFIINPEAVGRAIRKYTDMPLLELVSGGMSKGYSLNDTLNPDECLMSLALSDDDKTAAKALLKNISAEKIVNDKNVTLGAELLIGAPVLDGIDLGVATLVGLKGAVPKALSKMQFPGSSLWLTSLDTNTSCGSLRDAVARFDEFRHWALSYAVKSRCGALSSFSGLSKWLHMMSADDAQKTKQFLLQKFDVEIKTKMDISRGILFTKMLISALPQDEDIKRIIASEVGYLVKRALLDSDTEILSYGIEKNILSAQEVASCVRDKDEFETLVRIDKSMRRLLQRHLPAKVKRELVVTDFEL